MIDLCSTAAVLLIVGCCLVMALDVQRDDDQPADIPVMLPDCECVPRHKGAR